jgi:hypothetical protein
VGDLALVEGGKLVPMPKPPSEDMEVLKDSLANIEITKGVEMILTAHTGVFKK